MDESNYVEIGRIVQLYQEEDCKVKMSGQPGVTQVCYESRKKKCFR